MNKIAIFDTDIDNLIYIRKEITDCLNTKIDVTIYTNKDELLLDIYKFDVIFISTYSIDYGVYDFSKKIRSVNKEVKLVFVSDIEPSQSESFRLRTFSFIKKSELKIELPMVLDDLINEIDFKEKIMIFKENNSTVGVDIENIIYFESFGHNIEVHTADNKVINIRTSLKSLEKQLESKCFLRIHKSYILNTHYIYSVSRQKVTLSNMSELPISKGKADEIRVKLKNNLGVYQYYPYKSSGRALSFFP